MNIFERIFLKYQSAMPISGNSTFLPSFETIKINDFGLCKHWMNIVTENDTRYEQLYVGRGLQHQFPSTIFYKDSLKDFSTINKRFIRKALKEVYDNKTGCYMNFMTASATDDFDIVHFLALPIDYPETQAPTFIFAYLFVYDEQSDGIISHVPQQEKIIKIATFDIGFGTSNLIEEMKFSDIIEITKIDKTSHVVANFKENEKSAVLC